LYGPRHVRSVMLRPLANILQYGPRTRVLYWELLARGRHGSTDRGPIFPSTA